MKKISLLLLLVPTLLFGQGWYYSHVETGAGPLIRTDNFNRASLGSNWTALWNSHSISASTVLVGNTGGDENASYWNADTPGNDQYSELQKVDDFDGGGPTVRVQTGSQSFYLLYDPISPSAVLIPPSCIVLPLPCAGASRVNRKPRFPLKVSPNFPV